MLLTSYARAGANKSIMAIKAALTIFNPPAVNKRYNSGKGFIRVMHQFAMLEPYKTELLRPLVFLSAVIMLWRGIWNLLDIHLMPENPTMSALISIVLGLLVLGVSHQMRRAV